MAENNSKPNYDDIIHLPHHVSQTHPPMPAASRAAQFSPFAALTGFEDAVKETGRLTEERMELNEDARKVLDEKLQILLEQTKERPGAEITYFQPDKKKDGGTYVVVEGCVRKADSYERVLVMEDGERIPVKEIVDIKIVSPPKQG